MSEPWYVAAILVKTPEGLLPLTITVPPGKQAKHRACVAAYIIARYTTERKEA